MWPFKRKEKIETRSAMIGYTADMLAARENYLSGSRGVGELTATVQSCASLWEHGLGIGEVTGTDLLDTQSLAIIGRSMALRGEAVFLLSADSLVPVSDWDLSTRYGKPYAYRCTIPEIGGGRTQNALAAEVLHFRIGADAGAPWAGKSPLTRSSLTAGMLQEIETALAETFENAPIGTTIVPFPETSEPDLQKLGAGFRGKRGRVMLRESVNVQAAGGPAPNTDWRPVDVSPDLQRSMTVESLDAARDSILSVYGVLPALFDNNTTGPLVREAQRHLAQWFLQPIANIIAEEASQKLEAGIRIDVMQPLQAFDAGGRARTVASIVEALARAKEAGVDPSKALELVNWE